MKQKIFLLQFFILFLSSCKYLTKQQIIVKNAEEFHNAVERVQPGESIVLSNGVWNNTELLFEAKGTKEKPITLTVEEKGKVFLEGLSNLRISGRYLIVEGIIFRNGYTPTNEVISFKKDNNTLAYHCRLTECVIDNFSNPERHESDTWIAIYGKNNRVDHNHIEGKSNKGVSIAVRLNSKESQKNNHLIDHNYFGPRQILGSNGGETLRIGTSHYSLADSKTIIEYNYFDKCDGEHEIISNKSCKNTFRYNVFFECIGTLTMRHGNETTIDGNVFIGNKKANTGGIRVINGQQTVINNYAIDLTGHRFRGALVIMNGVPNSPLNRYFQVQDALIKNNVFINCDNIQLCAGSDKERSATPIRSVVENNIFYHKQKSNLFTIYDDISGIEFKNNLVNDKVKIDFSDGFKKTNIRLTKNKEGYLIPKSKDIHAPFTIHKNIIHKENTGVKWYPKKEKRVYFNSGKTIQVEAGMNTLFDAVKTAISGDIIELISGSTYSLTKTIEVDKVLTFKSTSEKKPILLFEKKALFDIVNGGSLSLENLKFDGEHSPDGSGNAIIRTSKYSMNKNYKLVINNCEFENLDVNHSFDVLRIYKNTFADSILITNSKFNNVTGHILALDKETDDIGIYNAEYVILKNNLFTNIKGAVLTLHRGGKDESTFGPCLFIDHCTFDNVGHGKRNKYNASISLFGTQVNEISNNIFTNCKPIKMHLVVGDPIVNIMNNNLYHSGNIRITGDQKYLINNLWNIKPSYAKGSYKLATHSSLKRKGIDKLDLGMLH